MSEENKVTYADIVKFYADKDDTDEVAEVKDDNYGKVAYCVWFARAYKGICFPEYRIKVNEDIDSKSGERIIREGPSDDRSREYWRSFEWENIRYDVHHSADDYVFAWLFVNRIQKKNNRQWDTVTLYNDYKGDKRQEFYEWFINRCNPIKGCLYKPGQKWHLFEFLLYSELNKEYGFSTADKIDVNESIYKFEEDEYGKKCGNRLFTRTGYPPLWRWMFEPTVNNLAERKKKIIEVILEKKE